MQDLPPGLTPKYFISPEISTVLDLVCLWDSYEPSKSTDKAPTPIFPFTSALRSSASTFSLYFTVNITSRTAPYYNLPIY